jgi:hypothetical protein
MSATPTCKTMCGTCPFRDGSPYAYLRADLEQSALTQSSRICHSTGSNNAINKRTGKPPRLCRGARDLQLRYMHGIGFISAPTDEAWNKRCKELGIPTPK